MRILSISSKTVKGKGNAMSDVKKVQEDITSEDLDKIMQDIAKEEAAPQKAPNPGLSLIKGAEQQAPKAAKEQALTLELTGQINLKLNFSSGERSIEVFCTEEALLCRMADGTEFRIPTGIAAPVKKQKAG